MNNNSPEQLREDATNVLECTEDLVEHICHEYTLSGEKVWVMIHTLAVTKMLEFPELREELEDKYGEFN